MSGENRMGVVEPTMWEWIVWVVVEWAFLKPISKGRIELTLPNGEKRVYGDLQADLVGYAVILSWQTWVRLAFQDDIGFCEAYMEGLWTSPDLTTLVCVLLEQMKEPGRVLGIPFLKQMELGMKSVYNRFFVRNTRSVSLKNVEQHYDIGNDLYERMLDPSTFSYTCALWRDPADPHFIGQGQFASQNSYPPPPPTGRGGSAASGHFPDDQTTTAAPTQAEEEAPLPLVGDSEDGRTTPQRTPLCDAQINKIELLIRKGNIQKQHRVLELGCGFGGFSKHLAKTVGCTVDAYNLSVEQLVLARQKAIEEGVEDLISYVHDDYRNCVLYTKDPLTGKHRKREGEEVPLKYDVIISIGMLEHVGERDLPTFFETCARSLKPGGTLCVHTITHCEHGYPQAKYHHGFIQKYIFPGAVIPAPGAVIDAAVWGSSHLELQHFENIGEHYAPTLRGWRQNFYKNLDEIRTLQKADGSRKYDVSFLRMWDFYLCNCEAEFLSGHMGLGHFVFKKPGSEFRSLAAQLHIMKPLDCLQLDDDHVLGGGGNKTDARSTKTKRE